MENEPSHTRSLRNSVATVRLKATSPKARQIAKRLGIWLLGILILVIIPAAVVSRQSHLSFLLSALIVVEFELLGFVLLSEIAIIAAAIIDIRWLDKGYLKREQARLEREIAERKKAKASKSTTG